MATVAVLPSSIRIGQSPTIIGEGFAASTPVVIRITEEGFQAEIPSNAGGMVSNDDIADHASVTLTAAANPLNNETVTLGSRTYTYKTTLTGAANEVLIGAAATNSLDNLKAAVNGAAGAGTTYGAGTVANADIIAGAKTATTIVFHARLGGTDGNSLASTETSAAGLSFGTATLVGGTADPTGIKLMDWTPTRPGTFTVTGSDGTSSASTSVRVFASA
jgi:hypothetical protein